MGLREVVEAAGLLVLIVLATALVARSRRRRLPPVATDVAERVRSATRASEFAHILVPTQGGVESDRMVLLACKLARPDEAQVEVLYFVEVPMSMAPTAELPQEMSKASQALAEAELI